jgi:hypothetical protein
VSSGPKPLPDNSEKESPFQYHIDFLRDIGDLAKSKDVEELEHPRTMGNVIFIRTTIREKELDMRNLHHITKPLKKPS